MDDGREKMGVEIRRRREGRRHKAEKEMSCRRQRRYMKRELEGVEGKKEENRRKGDKVNQMRREGGRLKRKRECGGGRLKRKRECGGGRLKRKSECGGGRLKRKSECGGGSKNLRLVYFLLERSKN